MNDKNSDDLLEQMLNEPVQQADLDVKKATINASITAFENAHVEKNINSFQGSQDSARLTENTTWFNTFIVKPLFSVMSQIRRFFMSTQNNRAMYSAFGTAAVAFVALSFAFTMPQFWQAKKLETSLSDFVVDDMQIGSVIQEVKEDDLAIINTKPLSSAKDAVASIDGENEVIVSVAIAKPSRVQPAPKVALNKMSSRVVDKSELESGHTVEKRRLAESPREMVVTGQVVNEYRNEALQSLSGMAMPQSTISYEPLPSHPDTRLDENEQYPEYQTNSIKLVKEEPVSTFSIDVDTASYSLIRNQLNNGYLPKPNAVRAEELINYFDYDYALPANRSIPFKPTVTVLDSPWNESKKLVHIGIKGYDIAADQQPDSNLVFLLDVSGSMNGRNKLPLVKQSVALLLETLKPTDTISIVVYAGAAGVVLEPTKAENKTTILEALNRLSAGGSTAGGAGIELAYNLAEQNFKKDSVNRIVLATDGDFNVGMSANEDLKTYVSRKRDKGIYLSVLGFGRNNYQDDMMQSLAQNGNGVAAFIDTLSEAKKVLVDEATSTLFPIAKDVKIQVEFNPAMVSEYRLVGYETRHLNREDFNNDKVDAGDIGAGHSVTAIYEITPVGSKGSVDALRYADEAKILTAKDGEYGHLKIRYKLPNESASKLIEQAIVAESEGQSNATNIDVGFSIAVGGFAQLMSEGKHQTDYSYDDVIAAAQKYKGKDEYGYRSEFIQLVRMAQIAKP